MNGLDTHFAYRDLIEIIEAAGDKIDRVVLPKVNRPEDILFVATLLEQIESYKGYSRPVGIEAVSYTHLDVYKRQPLICTGPMVLRSLSA